jgi:hypothetical protein
MSREGGSGHGGRRVSRDVYGDRPLVRPCTSQFDSRSEYNMQVYIPGCTIAEGVDSTVVAVAARQTLENKAHAFCKCPLYEAKV